MKTALQAAQEISALINSRAQSPRVDELEAIIAGVATCQHTSTQAMTPALAVLEWHRQLAEDDRKWMDGRLSEDEWTALDDGQVSRAKLAFARPVRSWEDVALLGALCIYWNFPHHDSNDQANMRELLGRPSRIGMDEQTLAHLLKAICTMGGFAPGEIPTTGTAAISAEDVDLCALRQKLAETSKLYEIDDGSHAATEKADAADNELTALSERIFATRPITLHNLKQRALLAKYWHQHRPDGEKWQAPSDCDAWEDQVMAHLIDGVLQIDAPPAEPSPDLALFLSALQGVEDYSRAHPEPPDVKSAEYDAWYAEHSQRLEGLNRVAERILSGNAPSLDVLAAIASEYVLLGGHPRAEQIADGEAHDGIPDWVVKRLVQALLPVAPA
jgi:hypothetical protein